MSDILNMVNDTIFVSLVNTTWQVTLLIPLIALIIWIFRIKSAATRYSLWLFVIFAMFALPLITPLIPQMDFAGSHSQRSAGDVPDNMMRLGMEGSAGELSAVSDPVPPVGAMKAAVGKEMDVSLINPVSIAYFVWCAGALFIFCATICAYGKLRKLRINSPDVRDPAVLELLSRLKRKIGVGRQVALKVSPKIYTPVSLGIFSPTIILPDGVMDSGSHDGMEMILTHELAHIKRHDYLINVIQNMLKVVFFFHPMFYLMNRNLVKEREHICDDWVIDMTEQRSGYAECIVGLLEKALHKPINIPVTIAMAERKRDIPGRIDMIVDKKRRINTKVPRKTLIALLLIGFLALPIIGGIGLVRFAGARQASDEGRIVFSRDYCIWTMDADGGSEKKLTFGGLDGTPAWSPDGTQIAFFHLSDDPDLRDIYVMNADSGDLKRLTRGPENDVCPTWSPDGKRIAFERSIWEQKGDNWEQKSSDIYTMNADGTDMRKLTESPPSFHGNPHWSPDGTEIVFELQTFSGQSSVKIWVMGADGSNKRIISDPGRNPAWSPDGKRIAFSSGRDWYSVWQTNDIYVVDADGSNVEILTKPDRECGLEPVWSPDGTKIAFCSYEGDKSSEIYVMNADGSNVQNLTKSLDDEWDPDWWGIPQHAIESAGKLKSTWGKIKHRLFSR